MTAANPASNLKSGVNTTAAVISEQEPNRSLARAEFAYREKRFGEADGICQDVLLANPNTLEAIVLRGFIATKQGKLTQAIALFERAVTVRPQVALWQSVLGDLYRSVNRLDEALLFTRKALEIEPKNANNLFNFARVLVDRGEPDSAIDYLMAALAIVPDSAEVHLCLGQILLARGDFRAGWIEYEWRNQLEQAQGRFPNVRAPLWNGMARSNARILLLGDQGYGDTIQFARYIPIVAERCGEVVLACSEDLKPLLSAISGVKECIFRWAEIPGFSAYALLSSLPYILGTELETIPLSCPYITADLNRVEAWEQRLRNNGHAKRRVGIFWAGRSTHPNDPRRSVPLAQFIELMKHENIDWVSLQKDIPPTDLDILAATPALFDCSSYLVDFGETAAAITNLDLLITIDSAVAHLAGAMGKPVWVVTPTPADWRWQNNANDSRWYPSLRLFRQPRAGDWNKVFADVARALAEL